MANLEYRKLSDEEVAEGLLSLPEWSVVEGQITRTFSFPTYKDGIVFAVAVGHLADKMDHHPDIYIGYKQVRLAVNTHSVEGLSPYDLELARRVDTLLN